MVGVSFMDLRKLDRVVKFDEASREYPVTEVIDKTVPRTKLWCSPGVLDQGTEGACVGFAWAHELSSSPKKVRGVTNFKALEIYMAAKRIDEWEGENYDGTSVLAGVKVLKNQGYIREYRWAFGEEDLCLAVSWQGPAVIGIYWYESMYFPDEDGFLRFSKNDHPVGGHAIEVVGYDTAGVYTLKNSWGSEWGKSGFCYMTKEDMNYLLRYQGEACIPTIRTNKEVFFLSRWLNL